MQDLWTYLKHTDKPIFIYGTGNGADKVIDELERRGIKLSGVFASDGFVRQRSFRGFSVISANEALANGDIIALMCFGSARAEVISFVRRLMEVAEVYAPDVPVADQSGVFDIEFARAHRKQLEEAYSLLADDMSRRVFENIVKFKLTGDIRLLFECESSADEAFSLLKLGDNEVYLDIGAYNGDTVLDFVNRVKGYNKIIAVEPDIKNFKKLTTNTAKLQNTECVNAAASDFSGETLFASRAGRNSSISNTGKAVRTVCVDSLAQNSPPTYIKMDVEGFELQVIDGAAKTLCEHKPKLNIATYHKNEDLFSIPLSIKKLNQEYKIYLRHHPYIPAWDTIFYMV